MIKRVIKSSSFSLHKLHPNAEWRIFDSITSLPPGLWHDTIAKNNVIKNEKLIELYEKYANNDKYIYFVAFNKSTIVGFALFTIYYKDITEHFSFFWSHLFDSFRKIYPKFLFCIEAMSGISDIDGQLWWHDKSFWSYDEFFSGLYKQIVLYDKKIRSIVFRCYKDHEITKDIILLYKKHSFCMVDEFPGTYIKFNEKHLAPEEYLSVLKNKDRYTIRKALKLSRINELKFEEISSMTNIWDQIYPLYLQTNEKAEDLLTEPLPKEFFIDLSSEKSLCPCIQVIKDRNGNIISFAFSIESDNVLHPFVIGMNYSINKELFLIYTTYWLFILRAISKGLTEINMGGTTEFVKQRFGAKIIPSKIFMRVNNPILNYILSPLIHKYY